MSENVFWMCYVDGRTGSTHKHTSFADAQNEAGRLARMNRGIRVYVLSVCGYSVIDECQWHDIDDIPF